MSYVIAASESLKIPSVVGSFNAFHTDTAIKLNTYGLLIALTIKSNNAFHVVKSCAVNPAQLIFLASNLLYSLLNLVKTNHRT